VKSASANIRAVTEKNSHENMTPMDQYVIGTLLGNEILRHLLYETRDQEIDTNELDIDKTCAIAD